MFQRFRFQSTQPSVNTTAESLDSPREETRLDTSVASDEPREAGNKNPTNRPFNQSCYPSSLLRLGVKRNQSPSFAP